MSNDGEGILGMDVAQQASASQEPVAEEVAFGAGDDWPSIGLLSLCWALTIGTFTAAIATLCLAARPFAPGPTAETLPLACAMYFEGVAQVALPLEFRTLGLRGSYVLGAAAGFVGCTLVALGAWIEVFGLVCMGGCLLGAAMAHGLNYRFVAMLIAPSNKATAASWILAGGVLGSILGPGVLARARGLFPVDYAGIYVLAACTHVLVAVLLCFARFPSAVGKAGAADAAKPRALKELFAQPKCWTAAAAISAAFVIMSLIMTPTPIAMRVLFGYTFDETTMVMMTHQVLMFAPSPVTGAGVSRCGTTPIMVTGCLLLGLSAMTLWVSTSLAAFFLGLALLGIGWNFLFIGGTVQLEGCYRTSEGVKVQAVNDAFFALFSGTSSLASAAIIDGIGWSVLPVMAMIASFATLIVVVVPFILEVEVWQYAAGGTREHVHISGVGGSVLGKASGECPHKPGECGGGPLGGGSDVE
eukprot:NODE_3113_length_2090_cov_17.708609.p1 GENE.NODE_3113_length_2090_cov_17.708609~~NODE_3113_length_2090_cov_17.708609.p1  ORF type:complete len:472 (-),score=35.41 NODE_3113_length_2090_cov_17.708609:444-1859(-)